MPLETNIRPFYLERTKEEHWHLRLMARLKLYRLEEIHDLRIIHAHDSIDFPVPVFPIGEANVEHVACSELMGPGAIAMFASPDVSEETKRYMLKLLIGDKGSERITFNTFFMWLCDKYGLRTLRKKAELFRSLTRRKISYHSYSIYTDQLMSWSATNENWVDIIDLKHISDRILKDIASSYGMAFSFMQKDPRIVHIGYKRDGKEYVKLLAPARDYRWPDGFKIALPPAIVSGVVLNGKEVQARKVELRRLNRNKSWIIFGNNKPLDVVPDTEMWTLEFLESEDGKKLKTCVGSPVIDVEKGKYSPKQEARDSRKTVIVVTDILKPLAEIDVPLVAFAFLSDMARKFITGEEISTVDVSKEQYNNRTRYIPNTKAELAPIVKELGQHVYREKLKVAAMPAEKIRDKFNTYVEEITDKIVVGIIKHIRMSVTGNLKVVSTTSRLCTVLAKNLSRREAKEIVPGLEYANVETKGLGFTEYSYGSVRPIRLKIRLHNLLPIVQEIFPQGQMLCQEARGAILQALSLKIGQIDYFNPSPIIPSFMSSRRDVDSILLQKSGITMRLSIPIIFSYKELLGVSLWPNVRIG